MGWGNKELQQVIKFCENSFGSVLFEQSHKLFYSDQGCLRQLSLYVAGDNSIWLSAYSRYDSCPDVVFNILASNMICYLILDVNSSYFDIYMDYKNSYPSKYIQSLHRDFVVPVDALIFSDVCCSTINKVLLDFMGSVTNTVWFDKNFWRGRWVEYCLLHIADIEKRYTNLMPPIARWSYHKKINSTFDA